MRMNKSFAAVFEKTITKKKRIEVSRIASEEANARQNSTAEKRSFAWSHIRSMHNCSPLYRISSCIICLIRQAVFVVGKSKCRSVTYFFKF